MFPHPQIVLHLTPPLYFNSPEYHRSLLFWPQLTFPWPGAHIAFSLKGNWIFAPRSLPFILFYVLHFACCSPLILHTSWKHLFQVSPSKGNGENKCTLEAWARPSRANKSRFLLGSPGGASPSVSVLRRCCGHEARCDPDTCWSTRQQPSSGYSIPV